MSCIQRISRQVFTALVLAVLIAAAPAAGAAPPEGRIATTATGDDDWTGSLSAPWRAFRELILNLAGADGTEEPPPPPPPQPDDEDDDLRPPDPPTCPPGQTGGPCVDPGS